MKHIEKNISGPLYPGRNFIHSKYTFEDVYKIGHALQQSLNDIHFKKNDVVCLFTENKALIAGTILATLEKGPEVAMPFSCSRQALFEMHEILGFNAVIADADIEVPEGVPLIKPQISELPAILEIDLSLVDPEREFIHFYTGGSTGKPQRWSKSAKNLFSEAVHHAETYHFSEKDIFLSTVPPYHIYGFLWSVLIPFVSSATVVADIYTYPHEITEKIQEMNATVLVSVPIHYRIIKGQDLKESDLKFAFSSAGMLDKDDGEAFTRGCGVPLHEIYGSTETGGIASRCRADGDVFFSPFDHIDWHIKDERLFVKSDSISSNAEKNPEGFFMVGDCISQVDNHSFELLNRADDVVKVGGKRVDLNQICEKIKSLAGVRDAVAVSLSTETGRENIIATLVAVDDGRFDKHHVRQKLSPLLEPYAIPRIIRVVEKIPVTATGKYDRGAIERSLNRQDN